MEGAPEVEVFALGMAAGAVVDDSDPGGGGIVPLSLETAETAAGATVFTSGAGWLEATGALEGGRGTDSTEGGGGGMRSESGITGISLEAGNSGADDAGTLTAGGGTGGAATAGAGDVVVAEGSMAGGGPAGFWARSP